MSSILSAISGQFSKSIMLGTFMPVALFVGLNLLFVLPLFPSDPQPLQSIVDVNTREAIELTLLIIVLTGLLYNLNIPIVRLYEGYTWQNSAIGQWRKRYYESQLQITSELRPFVQDLSITLTRRAENAAQREARETIQGLRSELGRSYNRDFPISRASILPTRLGNVIRSFENYPQRQYGMAAITLYPRLVATIDKEYLGQIDNAKTAFDFMINCSLLSAVLSVTLLITGLLSAVVITVPQLSIYWLIEIVAFLFLTSAFYRSSIGRASEWGDLVKGAFDLYRWKLLKELGYKIVPATMEQERGLWREISGQMIYGDRNTARLPEYASTKSYAWGQPASLKLTISRGVAPTDNKGVVKVTLRVKNEDKKEQDATAVFLMDTLPDGFHRVWNSARLFRERKPCEVENSDNGEPPVITGTNPYRFEIGDLPHNKQVVLTYEAFWLNTDGSEEVSGQETELLGRKAAQEKG